MRLHEDVGEGGRGRRAVCRDSAGDGQTDGNGKADSDGTV